MITEAKQKLNPGCLDDGTHLQDNDKIFCDPMYTWEKYEAGELPKLEVPANVIEVKNHLAFVEIVDERTPAGKRIWYNTETYGCTCHVLLSSITRRKE